MRHHTPLRYPGGKSKVANYIKLILEINKIRDGIYIEPYAGGAGVALALLIDEYVREIHINDLNPSIYSFWFAVLNETEELCSMIINTDVSMEEWEKQYFIQENIQDKSNIEIAFSTFFLNRTNRSGIITKAGVIGGKDQSGKWKIDARYNKNDLVERIRFIAAYRDRINLTNIDALKLISSELYTSDDAFIYLDPPYYVAGQELYANFYKPEDHADIAEAVKSLTQPWIVSYDNVPQIQELYGSFRKLQYGLSYSAATKYVGSEIMFFSNNLLIPYIESPTGLSSEMVNMSSETSLFPIQEI